MAQLLSQDDYNQIINEAYEKFKNVNYPKVELPANYRRITPQTEIISKGYTEAIAPLAEKEVELSGDIADLKTTYQTQLENISQLMKDTEKTQSAMPAPERSETADVMMALAPMLGGIFLGEEGALSGPAAAERARGLYEGKLKESAERAKLMRESQSLKAKEKLSAALDVAKLAQTGLSQKEDVGMKLGQEISRARQVGAKEMADIETRALERAQKQTEKPEQLPPHIGSYLRSAGSSLQKTDESIAVLSDMATRAADPNKDASVRLSYAQNQLKWVNSTLGPDALSNEEYKRAAAWLDPMPNWVKNYGGADLEKFSEMINEVVENQKIKRVAMMTSVDKFYTEAGSRFAKPGQSFMTPSAPAPPPAPKIPMTRQEKIDFLKEK